MFRRSVKVVSERVYQGMVKSILIIKYKILRIDITKISLPLAFGKINSVANEKCHDQSHDIDRSSICNRVNLMMFLVNKVRPN